MVVGWATEPLHGVHAAGIALAGIACILVFNLDDWRELHRRPRRLGRPHLARRTRGDGQAA